MFIEKLSEILKKEDVIVTDMGLSFVGTHQAFKVKKVKIIFKLNGHANGLGLLCCSRACYASKKNRICITGEGGLQMNIQEFATIMHNRLPVNFILTMEDI